MRFAARRGRPDANQASIVKAYRQVGASVVDLHAVGGGCPDLLVGWRGVTYLIELKTADGELLTSQEAFAERWRGMRVKVVRSVAEALQAIGVALNA